MKHHHHHQWRLLRLRFRSHLHTTSLSSTPHLLHSANSTPQHNLLPLRSLTSLLHPQFHTTHQKLLKHNFSSHPALQQEDSNHVVVTDIFTKFSDENDIKKELESRAVFVSSDLVMKVLRSFEDTPDVAKRFFDWVMENHAEKVSSKGYTKILCILGVHGLVDEFWGLFEGMRKKGFGLSKCARDKALERFRIDGLSGDVEKLEAIYASGSTNVVAKICRIVRSEVWGDGVEEKLKDLDAGWSSELVETVLEGLGDEPMKGLIFFRWVEESGLFKHDGRTYNAISRVLGRKDCIDRFWKVVDEMRSAGFEMEKETYVEVLRMFVKNKMIKDAIDLYEFAMAGGNKPSAEDLTFLLRKISTGKKLDLGLFLRAVRAFTADGNVLSTSMLDAVLKALVSVGRLGEINKVLKVMEESGFVAKTGSLPSNIAYRLSSSGMQDEASQFMDILEASGSLPDLRTWTSLIEGYCVAGDLVKATDSLQKMVEKMDISSVDHAFELLARAYCHKNKAIDASKLLSDLVRKRELKPRHTTYKLLINNLLARGAFKEALDVLTLMRTHCFPPFTDPCIEYISKCGSADDAIVFLKATTSKKFPSKIVFLRLFEGFLKAKRHTVAQDVLSKCPSFIRNHADVLNLFYSKKSGGVSTAALSA